MRAKRTPSSGTSPKWPSWISKAATPSHMPFVGSALNWQGQPQAQLQLTTSSPAILHLILFIGLASRTPQYRHFALSVSKAGRIGPLTLTWVAQRAGLLVLAR